MHQQGQLPTFRQGGTPFATVAALDDWSALQKGHQPFTNTADGPMHESMENEPTFTRQTVCQLARVPEEVFAFWVKRELLSPVGGGVGKGSHRRYTLDHIRITCLLRAARDAGLNIGALSFIAQRATAAIAAFRSHDMPHRYFLDVVSAAGSIRVHRRKGDADHEPDFSYLAGYDQLSPDDAAKLNFVANALADSNPHDPLLFIGHELIEATGYLTVSKNDDGSWDLQSGALEELGKSTEATSDFYLAFSVGRIMAPLASFIGGGEA